MKVFVGCTKRQLLPFLVLRHTIMSTTKDSSSVDVVPMYEHAGMIPKVRRKKSRPRTPFSFQRFLMPYLCMYSGKAVYLDSDMLVFSDVQKLVDSPMGSASVLTPPKDGRGAQFAVMVVDCGAVRWDIKVICERLEAGALSYETLMSLSGLGVTVSTSLSRRWNDLDKYYEDTKLLHYTRMEMQPWLVKGHPLERIWAMKLRDAVVAGDVHVNLIKKEVGLGHVRPGVLKMVKRVGARV